MPTYKTATPTAPISLEDMNRYMAQDLEPWVKAIVICLWTYGIRISEALAVKRFDFYEAEGFLWLDSTPLKNPDKQRRVLPVPLNSPHLDQLIFYINTLDQTALVWPYNSMNVWRNLKKIDSSLCAHKFRHNRATVTALQRPHPFELQSWLGHKSIVSTMKYIHASGVFAEDLGKKIIIR